MTAAFREYLNRPRDLLAALLRAREQASDLWAACTKMTTSYDGVGGHGGGGGDSKDGALAAYADLTTPEDYKRELDLARAELGWFLKSLAEADPKHGFRDAALLEERYLKFRGWEATMFELNRRGFTCGHLQTAYYWHRGALSRAERFWEEINGL